MSTPHCPNCAAEVPEGANFCESCGAQLGDIDQAAAAALPRTHADAAVPVSRPTTIAAAAGPVATHAKPANCRECGGEVADDGYCQTCGAKAPTEREHFVETPAGWVAGVCDRGRLHDRNEDAMALWADEGRAVLVICDGVSSSRDSDVAALAGARAARDHLRPPLPAGMGTDSARLAAVTKVLTDAVADANEAIITATAADSDNPASATCTSVVVERSGAAATLWHANVGDSRSYWIPDVGTPLQLTVDDSGAQAQIAAGVSREIAESSADAHGITKWLGRDSLDHTPVVGRLDVAGPGWVLACSDGLWNYASAPESMATQVVAATVAGEPLEIAEMLVTWANEQGGRDNITVALARLGPLLIGENVTTESKETNLNG